MSVNLNNKDEISRAKEKVAAKTNSKNDANIMGFYIPFWVILVIILILLYILGVLLGVIESPFSTETVYTLKNQELFNIDSYSAMPPLSYYSSHDVDYYYIKP